MGDLTLRVRRSGSTGGLAGGREARHWPTFLAQAAAPGAKGGQIEFRVEKQGIIHSGIGKLSFKDEDLKTNFKALTDAIVKAKPSGAKGKYVRKVTLTSSMGPGLKVDLEEIEGA